MKYGLVVAMLLAASAAQAEIIDVNNQELISLMATQVPLVDIRTPGEWRQTGVVAGSHLIMFADEKRQIDPEGFKQQMSRVTSADQPVILICRSGSRTLAAAKILDGVNPERKIYNVKEGINGWIRARQPVIPMEENSKIEGVKCNPQC